ncbi:Exo-glucosaminidase LytG [Austwickia sp. TVS 96-490-7B]|uniref:sporangiospore maturation cell wall hydrolase GsmA n=1 Tax=Austwickia sp. TVS 96-490-7B TaxID=2830843 RepID=UPI001C5667E0|nr:sporangiospore maturation cell wall hydrolase GsmA [Austwickia sp. TVS 96-490-7B]MBW3084638.1 Exo-glucosaminidase LytG [Austwickia sp. TVS 96-490-7B]
MTWPKLTPRRTLVTAVATLTGAAVPILSPMSPLESTAQAAPAKSQSTFIATLAPAARQSQRATGVPASVTLAQAILESGWGQSKLASQSNNYFGIKCLSGTGPYAKGCITMTTQECAKGKCSPQKASFRTYGTVAASMKDHGNFLRVNPRYAKAFSYTRNPDQFAREIHKAGYATSPTYAATLISVMRTYRLYLYDVR